MALTPRDFKCIVGNDASCFNDFQIHSLPFQIDTDHNRVIATAKAAHASKNKIHFFRLIFH